MSAEERRIFNFGLAVFFILAVLGWYGVATMPTSWLSGVIAGGSSAAVLIWIIQWWLAVR